MLYIYTLFSTIIKVKFNKIKTLFHLLSLYLSPLQSPALSVAMEMLIRPAILLIKFLWDLKSYFHPPNDTKGKLNCKDCYLYGICLGNDLNTGSVVRKTNRLQPDFFFF